MCMNMFVFKDGYQVQQGEVIWNPREKAKTRLKEGLLSKKHRKDNELS